MTAPAFGDTDALDRPTFGTVPGRVDHICPARWSLPCSHPGPHARPAAPDPGTVALFPDLEPTPSLWAAGPPAEPPQDVPEHYDPRPEPEPEPAPGWRIVEPLTGATVSVLAVTPGDPCPVRWSDTPDGFLLPCHLRAGHAGRHV